VTKDVTDIIAQLPPVLQALSGVDLEALVANLPKLKEMSATPTRSADRPPKA
jgi:hypothetical protein